jgi:hypothetical protein
LAAECEAPSGGTTSDHDQGNRYEHGSAPTHAWLRLGDQRVEREGTSWKVLEQ